MQQKITLSADKTVIERAHRLAEAHNTTLNAEFRRWLAQYTESPQSADNLAALMEQFTYVDPGRRFTRDEMNER